MEDCLHGEDRPPHAPRYGQPAGGIILLKCILVEIVYTWQRTQRTLDEFDKYLVVVMCFKTSIYIRQNQTITLTFAGLRRPRITLV